MKNLSRNDKIILIVVVMAVILFLYYQFLLSPVLSNMMSNISSVKSDKSQINVIETTNATDKSANKRLKTEYKEKSKSLPIEMKDPEIQNKLNDLAASKKVTIKSINFADPVSGSLDSKSNQKASTASSTSSKKTVSTGALMQVSVTVNMEGNYTDIIEFLKSVEEENRISEIQSVNIAKNTTNSQSTAPQTSTAVINYYYLSGKDTDKKEIKYDDITKPAQGKLNLFN